MGEDLKQMTEREPSPGVAWTEVLFGHRWRDFDRDQFMTYWLALQAGLVDSNASISCAPTATKEDLQNYKKLVIEGIPPDAEKNLKTIEVGRNKANWIKNPGNWDNGPDGESAAEEFWKRYSQEIIEHSGIPKDTLQALLKWFSTTEKRNAATTELPTLDDKKLSLTFGTILHGLKAAYPQPAQAAEYLQAMSQVLADALSPLPQNEFLAKHQAAHDAAVVAKREAIERTQEALKREPQRVQRTELLQFGNTVSLVYIDTRGIKDPRSTLTHAGVMSADLALLVGDEYDDNEQIVGTKLTWQIIRKTTEPRITQNDLNELARRLNATEMLFGKDRLTISLAPFGGHADSVHSSRLSSHLDPARMWLEVQKYFAALRMTHGEMEAVADQMAGVTQSESIPHYPGLENIVVNQTPLDQSTHISERFIQVQVPDSSGQQVLVQLNERDLPYYLRELSTSDAAHNRALLLEKAQRGDTRTVESKKAQAAAEQLDRLIELGDGVGILLQIDQLPPEKIQALSLQQQLTLWQLVCNNSAARDLVWNKENLTFRITGVIPEWITTKPEYYIPSRYLYQSVPQKVDTVLAESLSRQLTKMSPQLQTDFVTAGLQVLTSEEYRESHRDGGHDLLVQSLLRVALNRSVDVQVRERIVQTLHDSYSQEMHDHWAKIAKLDPGLVLQAQETYPQLKEIGIEISAEVLSDVPEAFIVKPSAEQIQESLRRQQEQGFSVPYVNLVVDVGGRDNQQSLQKGVWRLPTGLDSVSHREFGVVPDALFGCKRPLKLGPEHLEQHKVADAIFSLLIELFRVAPKDAVVRIVKGSLPGIQQESNGLIIGALMTAVYNKCKEIGSAEKFDRLKKRIVVADFYVQDEQWHDHPLDSQVAEKVASRLDELMELI